MYKIRRGNAEAEGGTAEYNGGAEERATRPGRGRISNLSGRRPYLSDPPREMAKWYEMHTSPTPGRLFGDLRKYVKIKVS